MTEQISSAAPSRAKVSSRKTTNKASDVTQPVVSLDERRELARFEHPSTCPRFTLEVGSRWSHLVGIVEHKARTVEVDGEDVTEMQREVIFPLPVMIAERHLSVSASDHRARVAKLVLNFLPLSAFPAASEMSREERAKITRTVTLDAREWSEFTWPDDLPELVQWNDSAASKAKLREALRIASAPFVRTVLSSAESGWVNDGEWHFITASGAIGPHGAVASRSGLSGNLAQMLTPFDLHVHVGPVTHDDVMDVLTMQGVFPARFGAPVLGTALWSPVAGRRTGALGAIDPSSGLAVLLAGMTGAGKSLTMAAMWSLFATSVDADHLPGPQGSVKSTTAVGISSWTAGALGVPATIDDVSPDDAQAGQQRLAETIRATFNNTVTMKGTRTGGIAPPRVARATVVISAEDALIGQSIRNRAMVLSYARREIDTPKLGAWVARRDGRRRAMAGFVSWIAANRLAVADLVEVTQPRLALHLVSGVDVASPFVQDASRVARQYARAGTGIAVFLRWAVEAGHLTHDDATSFWASSWHGLCSAYGAQLASFVGGSTTAQIRRALRVALDSGRAHIEGRDTGAAPSDARHLGWSGPDMSMLSPRGATIGWTEGGELWLSPEVASSVIRDVSASLGQPLHESGEAMGRHLKTSGVLVGADENRTTKRVRIGGTSRKVWPMSLAWLMEDEDEGGDSGFAPPPAPPFDGDPMPEPEPVTVVDVVEPEPEPEPGPEPEPIKAPERLSEPVSQPEPVKAPEPVSAPVRATPVSSGSFYSPEPEPEPKRAAKTVAPKRERRDSGRLGVGMDVTADEIREAVRWAQEEGPSPLTPDAAHAVVQRWHEVTGCGWTGTHGVINSLLRGHTRWPGAKTPKPADLGLFRELRAEGEWFSRRSWIVTPGAPADESGIVMADVNAQFVAAAGTVELGEGNPEHWEPGETLPDDTLKRPGWVHLKRAVKGAPHGLDLPAGMWVPTSIATYLTVDRKLKLVYDEALIWPEKRRALGSVAAHFRDWRSVLAKDTTSEGRMALAMLKSTYAKALGGYLASEKGLTPPEWRRPDWASLLKALATANMLRALDKLPEGVIVRATFVDAAYLEVPQGVDLSAWPNLDPTKPGKWKLSPEFSAVEFADCAGPSAWHDTMESLTEFNTMDALKGGE